jgi:hypothetical protein
MKRVINILILCLALMAGVAYSPARTKYADCTDQLLQRAESPDGAFTAFLYHRQCDTGIRFTYVKVRKRPVPPALVGAEACQNPMTLTAHYSAEIVWKANRHLEISSPDLVDEENINSTEESCDELKISYEMRIKPRPSEESSDPRVIGMIRQAILMSEPCFNDDQMMDFFYRRFESGRHKSALDVLCNNLRLAECPLTREHYELLKEAGTAMEMESSTWEVLLPQVEGSNTQP